MPLAFSRSSENPRAYASSSRVPHHATAREAGVDKDQNQRKRIAIAVGRFSCVGKCLRADSQLEVLAMPQAED